MRGEDVMGENGRVKEGRKREV